MRYYTGTLVFIALFVVVFQPMSHEYPRAALSLGMCAAFLIGTHAKSFTESYLNH